MAPKVSTKKKVLLNSIGMMLTLSLYFLAIDVTALNRRRNSFGWPFENTFNGLNISSLLTLEERGNNMVCVCNCNSYKVPCSYEMLQRNRQNPSPSRPILGKLVQFNLFNLTYFDSLFKKKTKKTTTTTTQPSSTSTTSTSTSTTTSTSTSTSTTTTSTSRTTATTEKARAFSNVTNAMCLCECLSSRNACFWPLQNQHPGSYSSGSYFPFPDDRKLRTP